MLVLTLQQPSLWKQLSFIVQDLFIQHTTQNKHVDSVVLVDIDEASLEMMGAWPWSRSLIATLINKTATDYSAAAIGLDIVFPESTQSKEDNQLVTSVQTNKAVTAIVWDYQGQKPPLQVGHTGQGITIQSTQPLPQAKGYLGNFMALAETSQAGHISPMPDDNGKIRSVAPIVDWQGQGYPMLALSVLARAKGKSLYPVMHRHCLYPFAGEKTTLCLNNEGLWSIPYRYELSSFTVIPAWQIILEQAPEALLEKRQVIIGSSALGLADRVATPLASITPGMMVHAQMLASLQDGSQSTIKAGPSLWLWLTPTLILLSVILMQKGIRAGLLLVLCASLIWLLWVNHDYQQGEALPDIAQPMMIMFIWLISQSALEWSLVKRQSQRIYRLFRDYLPPHLLKQALVQPDDRMLRPQQRLVTVLFADISGFTTMTEQLPTEEAAKLTRHILSLLTQSVYDHDGTLDKYMGDALMAFWNAPLDQPEHRQLAIRAALSMRKNIKQLNETRATIGLAPIHVRIGINSGDVLVGDLGTQWRHAYTVLGDAVNVAQRLMIASAQLGVDIAVGENATDAIQYLQAVGEMHLPGRTRLERVFVIPVTI
jgi:adenylate cyclase